MVQGHVDGVARVTGVRTAGDARLVDLAVPPGLTDLMVRHGSIAVDGVSLTINDLPVPEIVQLSLIEYTLRHTALETLHAGDEVHVEADMIGKFVQKMVGVYRA
jgi:riboflavin synthase